MYQTDLRKTKLFKIGIRMKGNVKVSVVYVLLEMKTEVLQFSSLECYRMRKE